MHRFLSCFVVLLSFPCLFPLCTKLLTQMGSPLLCNRSQTSITLRNVKLMRLRVEIGLPLDCQSAWRGDLGLPLALPLWLSSLLNFMPGCPDSASYHLVHGQGGWRDGSTTPDIIPDVTFRCSGLIYIIHFSPDTHLPLFLKGCQH